MNNHLRAFWRNVKVLLCQVFALYWVIKIGYCVHAYFSGGMVRVRSVILHGSAIPLDPALWGHPQWERVALSYGTIALLTVVVGFMSKQELMQWWHVVRHGRTVE